MIRRLAPSLLLALFLALPRASPAVSPEAAGLLQRAEFWQARAREDLARAELDKLFRLERDHPEGLVMLARMQLRSDQDRDAGATLERLRIAHPGHPGIAQLAAQLRIRGPDKERLRQARQLGRAGRNEAAIRAYREIFPEGFPDDEMALEYAQLVAGTRDGKEAGRRLLVDLARKHPDDPRFQVALASHMSTRKPVAAETLKSLRELSASESVLVARQARESWRRAVLAMDPVEASLAALREYIASNPGETAVKERLDEVTQSLAQDRKVRTDPGLRAMREGWAALEAGRIEDAQARLQEAVALRPNDGEAAGGLGLVRLRQGRHAEALEQFRRARELDGSAAAKWNGMIQTARYWELLQLAGQAREAGQLDVAEARVREARAIDAKEPTAAIELARILLAAGRDLEAEALLGELTPAQRLSVSDAINAVRAGRLREQATQLQAQGGQAAAVAALEQAVALDPLDPWVRHDLARLYATAGDAQRGRALFDDLLRRRPGDADARHAFALFLSSTGRDSEALTVLEGVTAGERTEAMTRLQRRLWTTVQGRRAMAYASADQPSEAGQTLAAMREAVGADPDLSTVVVDLKLSFDLRQSEALRAAGRTADALRALQDALPAEPTPPQLARQRQEQARVLREMGRAPEATEIYRELVRANPGDSAAQLALAETLVEQGDVEAAQPLVESILRAHPDDARALAAAGRIAQRSGRLDDAISYEQRSLGSEAGSGDGWRYRRLAEMLDQRLSWNAAALDGLHRSGSAGKSQISAQELPWAHRQAWSPAGQWLFRVAPTRVDSGQLDLADAGESSTFGSLLLCIPLCADALPPSAEKGVALGAGFERDGWRFDLGTTPIGFPVVNLVGGVLHNGKLGPYSYSVDASRRAIASSLLSHAGTRDPNTGRTWGGVVATGLRLNLSRDSGGDYGAWGLAGLYRLSGRNVQDNDKAELMAGAYRRLINEDNRQLAVGLTGMLWRFSENAGEFTFGHGGYYSPRSYRSLSIPLTFGLRTALTSVFLRGSVSVSWSESRRAPFFPTDAQLQAGAEALAPVTGIDPFYGGGNNGRSYGRSFAALVEHQLAPDVFIGGRMELERSTNYTPNRFLLYVRYTPDGPAARPVSLPPEPVFLGFPY